MSLDQLWEFYGNMAADVRDDRTPPDERETAQRACESLRTQIEAAGARREGALLDLLQNLLARIFRDGGHRAATYATIDEAVAAADLVVADRDLAAYQALLGEENAGD